MNRPHSRIREALTRFAPFRRALSPRAQGRPAAAPEDHADSPPPDIAEELQGHGSLPELVKDCADLLAQVEEMQGTLEESAHPLAEHLCVTLEEMIERAGAVRIEDESAFDVTRHQPHPMKRIASGASIAETLSVGYTFQGRVIKRARVRVGSE